MPLKIPDNLPARESLLSEAVDIINSSYAERQDIRPLKFLLLNLMPKKIPTEIQFARLIGASPLQIELTLMTTKSYQPKNTNKDYLIQFYKTLDNIRHDFFDVLIVTGAPIETLPFEDVNYWDELCEIINWSKSNVFRRLGICWGSQVFLKIFYDVEKHDRLLQGFTNRFPMPVSRFTETRKQDLIDEDLEILAESTLSGVGMVRSQRTKDLYILNHLEYDAETLKDEYLRDKNENIKISIPENYFPDNDDQKLPVNRWRPYAFLLFSNFINEVYQDVPFDFGKNN